MTKSTDKQIFLINFGKRLKQFRIEKKLKQHQLAELACMSENYYGKLERGERNISIYQFGKIAKALNLDLNVFFKDLISEKK